jgi:RNA polymerase sigma-70 factor (ECF subfamily)
MSPSRFLRPQLVVGRPRAETERAERFRQTILPHLDAAYALARYLSRDATLAEDIVQDAFLRAFRSFETWRGEAPRAWLLAIVRNCFLNHVADRGCGDVPLEDLVERADPAAPDPEVAADRSQAAAKLRETIEQLPEPFREALVLREFAELSYKEIALTVGAPIGTVMSRLARARQMLVELLPAEVRSGT